MLDELVQMLLAHLGRGGTHQYFWSSDFQPKRSGWFPVGQPARVPEGRNVFFGVHPTHAARGLHQRARIDDVAAVNCLFSEFDLKDFDGGMKWIRLCVEAIPLPPSVVVHSGGGLHAYWLFRDPVPVTEANRDELRSLQARWVAYTGGDSGAKDLARVLRLPGTLNRKYDPPRPVELEYFDDDALYRPEIFAARLDVDGFPAKLVAPRPAVTPARVQTAPSLTDYAARAYAVAALDGELRELAAANRGQRNDRLNDAALKLGSLVAGGLLTQDEVISGLYATALAMGTDSSFTDRHIRATIKSGYTAGLRQPRGVPHAR